MFEVKTFTITKNRLMAIELRRFESTLPFHQICAVMYFDLWLLYYCINVCVCLFTHIPHDHCASWFIYGLTVCTTIYCRLYSWSPKWSAGLFDRAHRIPPATASIKWLEFHDHFPWPVPQSGFFAWMHVCYNSGSDRSVPVAVVSDIYNSDHWSLQAYL